MDFNATCPACGSVLPLSSGSRRVTCDFCGNQFVVDPSTALPALQRVTPAEMQPEPLPIQSAETESAETLPPSIRPPETPEPIFNPPPMFTSATPPARKRAFPTWAVIALAVTVILCGLCACLVLVWNYSGSQINF